MFASFGADRAAGRYHPPIRIFASVDACQDRFSHHKLVELDGQPAKFGGDENIIRMLGSCVAQNGISAASVEPVANPVCVCVAPVIRVLIECGRWSLPGP